VQEPAAFELPEEADPGADFHVREGGNRLGGHVGDRINGGSREPAPAPISAAMQAARIAMPAAISAGAVRDSARRNPWSEAPVGSNKSPGVVHTACSAARAATRRAGTRPGSSTHSDMPPSGGA